MRSVKIFNGLNGAQTSRTQLEELRQLAENERQHVIANRIAAFLGRFPNNETFIIETDSPAIEQIGENDICHIEELPQGEETQVGLGKPVSPDDIYQKISDRIAALLEEDIDWEKQWGSLAGEGGYLIAYNFESKKNYRGINRFLLGSLYIFDPTQPLLENPYYLTFKQIEKYKGKLRKGSKGKEAVYFTRLYKYEQAEPKLEFATYDYKKMVKWLNDNKDKINLFSFLTAESIANQSYYPILKYYNVFNGADVEGIDFDLDNFKGEGKIKASNPKNHEKIPEAEAIISNYPDPAPTMRFGGEKAFFRPSTDLVQMPVLASFNYVQAYYTTFFHELIHSTGSKKRLDRVMGKKFGDKDYAFEELIAELGASFLSGQAGILHYTMRNSAAYIKGWRKELLAIVKKDNRFFFRAASKAQAAADFMLQKDADGVPKYLKNFKPEVKKEAKTKTSKTTGTKSKLIPLKKITIQWAEGKTVGKFPKDFKTWKAANDAIKPIFEKGAGYNKVKFAVHFQDDEAWEGTLYLSEKEDNPFENGNVIGQHIYDFIQYALTDEAYITYKDVIPYMKEFVKKYDLGPIKKGSEGLGAPRHNGIARDALTECGRLKPGFKYEKGGKIVKIEKKENPKKKVSAKPDDSVKKKLTKSILAEKVYAWQLKQSAEIKKYYPKVSSIGNDEFIVEFYSNKELPTAYKHVGVYNLAGKYVYEVAEPQYNGEVDVLAIYGEYKVLETALAKVFDQKIKPKTLWAPDHISYKEYLERKNGPKKKTTVKKTKSKMPAGSKIVLPKTNAPRKVAADKFKVTIPPENFPNSKKYFEKALESLGFEIVDVKSTQKSPYEFKREYKLNFGDTGGVLFTMQALGTTGSPGSKEIATQVTIDGLGIVDREEIYDFQTIGQFYGQTWEFIRDTFNFSVTEALKLKKKYGNTVFSKKDKNQLGLFGAKAKKRKGPDPLKNNKKGLSAPIVLDSGVPITTPPLPAAVRDSAVPVWDMEVNGAQTMDPVKQLEAPKPIPAKKNSLVKQMNNLGRHNAEYFRTTGPLGEFLGNIEKKRKGSVVCTLDAPQGAMKTRLFFQKMNMLASQGNKILFISLEEDPDSVLFTGKRDQYISPQNRDRIDTVGELPNGVRDLEKLIPEYDVVFVDSWGKLAMLDKNLDLDKDFRKKYDGKLFFVIYQRTTAGTMRGGSSSQFDADMVMKIEKDADYKNNYAFFDKNRYQGKADLKYNIHGQKLTDGEEEETFSPAPNAAVELV